MNYLKMPSYGTVSATKSSVTFEWNIKDFSKICDIVKSGQFIRSPIFPTNIGECKCYITLHPNGLSKGDSFLYLNVRYVNKDVIKRSVVFRFSTYTIENTSKYGFWVSRDLLDCGVLKNDSMTILCELTEENKVDYEHLTEDMKRILKLKEFGDFEKLLEKNEHSDVTFVVQDKKLLAHKCILSARSSVFAAMFQHDMLENKGNTVQITDFSFEVMRELLRFIYTTKVDDIESLALDLYKAADKYDLQGLKNISEEAMCQNLDITNVFEYLNLTSFYDAVELKVAAIEFIAFHSDELKANLLKLNINSQS